jgi:hypothetical protein
MIASDDVAIVPVVPLATMFATTLPGATAANRPCIMFESALIGPQLVSPSTRSPTSISGIDRSIATTVIQTGIPRYWYCTITSAIAATAMPGTTMLSGISPEPIFAPRRLLNVEISRRQRSASAVRPPATSIPVAGHITQNRMFVRVGVPVKTAS